MRVTVALGIVMGLAGAAHADDPPKVEKGPPAFVIGPTSAWVLLGGVTTGGTVALADKGYFVGGELSLALLREGNHIGFYTDGYYDWGADGAYFTGGLEAGHKFLGIDGGIATRFADGTHEIGFTGRVSVGLGIVSLYGRLMHFPRGIGEMPIHDDNVIQVGIQLKLPLAAFGGM
jgi:hypothetical protein